MNDREMTDAELIDAAARAQGWIDFPNDSLEGSRTWYLDPDKAPFGRSFAKCYWNPLTDSSSALRLSVTLGMCVSHWPRSTGYEPHVMVGFAPGGNITEDYNGSPQAATRRAIVRAAAAMWLAKGGA